MSRKSAALTLVTMVLTLPVAVFGNGTAETDWLLLPSGGTYTWDGNPSDPLIGSNIGVKSVSGNGTPIANGKTLSITDGFLNFTSGAFNGRLGSTWSWGTGGTLNVMGCIAGVTASTCTGSNNVVLLSDDFQSVKIVAPISGSVFDLVLGQLQGVVNASVASYFGVPVAFSATSVNLMATKSTPGNNLYGTNVGGTIKVDPPISASEEWGFFSTLGFFALAVCAFGVGRRLGLLRPAVQ